MERKTVGGDGGENGVKVSSDWEDSKTSVEQPLIMYNSCDEALEAAGSFGYYQIVFVLLLHCFVIFYCGSFTFQAYAGYQSNATCTFANQTVIGRFDDKNTPNKLFCPAYENGDCEEVVWDKTFEGCISKFNLICDKSKHMTILQMVQNGLDTVTTSIAYLIIDSYGRKPVFAISLIICLALNWITPALSINFMAFAILRLLANTSLSVAASAKYLWVVECTTAKHVMINNCARQWMFAYMIQAVISLLVSAWKPYLYILTGIGTVSSLALFFSESLRWHMQRGDFKDAARILTRIAYYNGKKGPDGTALVITAEQLKNIHYEKKVNPWSGLKLLFNTKKVLTFAFVTDLLTAAIGTVPIAMIFTVQFIAGHPAWKFFWYGLARSPIPISAYFMDKKIKMIGRRLMLYPNLFIIWGLVAMILIINEAYGKMPGLFYWTLFFCSVLVNFLWIVQGQYEVELLPTRIRSTTNLIGVPFSIVSAVIPIYLVQATQELWGGLVYVYILVFLGLAIFVAFLILPETKGNPIPDTVEDTKGLRVHYKRASSAAIVPAAPPLEHAEQKY